MTKFQMARPNGPWDYPTLGFIAQTDGAILDGSLSSPPITMPPDPFWTVYAGGSAETGITRYGNPTVTPAPETTNGFLLAYSNSANTYVPTGPGSVLQTQAWVDALGAVVERGSARSFFDYFGSGLLAWEDSQRPDIANFSQFTEGYSSKSGHPITSDGAVNTNSILGISGHRMRWTDGTPGGTPIRISKMVLNQEPTRVGGLACFSTETTTLDTWNVNGLSSSHVGGNAPIGACATSFAQGSVQLALYRHGLLLFVVENPIVDPYYTPWSIAFDSRIPDDDTTPTAYYMDFDRPTSTITVHCPSKMANPVSITDAKFATYWGSTFGWQERRSAVTDARVSYKAVGAGVAA